MLEEILNKINECKETIVFLPKSDISYYDAFKYMYGDNIVLKIRL